MGTGTEMPSAGIGEIRIGEISLDEVVLATIEPMHGNQLVVYTHLKQGVDAQLVPATRIVLSDKLSEGHALAIGGLLGSDGDQIVGGWRGKPGAPDSTTGVAVWTPLDPKGEQWRETMIDADDMACEDLQLADLNGDGKLDIIASGRATRNSKIYLNETAPAQP